MAKGFKMGAGSADLSFSVAAYPSAAAMAAARPAENTFGIITTEKITGYVLSPVQPENPETGMVWILTGNIGSISIDLLRRNSVVVFPKLCRQYVSGSWVKVPSQLYRNGWEDYSVLYLYNNGNQTEYTWKCTESLKQTDGGYTSEDCLSESNGKLTVSNNTKAYSFTDAFVQLDDEFVKIDCALYSKLSIKGTLANAGSATACVLRLITDFGTLAADNNAFSQTLNSGTLDITLDISAVTSKCFIGFTCYNEKVNVNTVLEISEMVFS